MQRLSANSFSAAEQSAACSSAAAASAPVAANKLPDIRAAVCHDTYSARQGVEHDDMNILVLGARVIGEELARELVRAFLAAKYTAEERHRRRLAKIKALEKRYGEIGVREKTS
jgi:ribose 5-phosphate isomerase B